MENNVQVWRQKVRPVFTSVLIYSIASILITIIGAIAMVKIGMLETAGFKILWGTVAFKIPYYILGTAAFAGKILFIITLGYFGAILEKKAVGNVRLGMILLLVGLAIALIPHVGWGGKTLFIIAGWIMMLVGYMSLKNSPTFPQKREKAHRSVPRSDNQSCRRDS